MAKDPGSWEKRRQDAMAMAHTEWLYANDLPQAAASVERGDDELPDIEVESSGTGEIPGR